MTPPNGTGGPLSAIHAMLSACCLAAKAIEHFVRPPRPPGPPGS